MDSLPRELAAEQDSEHEQSAGLIVNMFVVCCTIHLLLQTVKRALVMTTRRALSRAHIDKTPLTHIPSENNGREGLV